MVPDEMSGPITIKYRHLTVHEYDMRHWLRRIKQIIQSLSTVPNRRYLKAKLLDGLDGNLLVDRTGEVN